MDFSTCFLSLSETLYESRRLFDTDCDIETRMDDYRLRQIEKRGKLQLIITSVLLQTKDNYKFFTFLRKGNEICFSFH